MSTFKQNEGAVPWPVPAPTKNNDLCIPNITNPEKIGNSDAARFLNLLTEGEFVTFQTFPDRKEIGSSTVHLTKILHGSLSEHLSELEKLNEAGAGIFFTVNETDLKGRKTENIKSVRALFVDLDGAPLAPVLSAPLPPHIVVETSLQRYHAYWLVEGVSLDQFPLIQKVLIKRFNGDPAVHDLSRVMRLPGFLHLKGEPFSVRILECSETLPYKSADFLERFQIDVKAPAALKSPKIGLSHDLILQELQKRNMIRGAIQSKLGGWEIICPYVHLHTTGDKGTAYFEANTNGYQGAAFKCQHAHCEEKTIEDLQEYLGLAQKEKNEWSDPLPLKEELLSVAPFREEMLPEMLRPWIMDASERMQIPPDFLAATCIVILGSLIGRKVGIYPKAHDDWLVIPNLWGAVVGRPSLLKSPAIAEMMKPLEKLAAEAIQQHDQQLLVHEQEQMWLDVRKTAQKDAMKKAIKNNGISKMPKFDQIESLAEPVLKRYKTEDGTVEKIGEILLKNPQGILIHRDELVGWLKSLDKFGREGDRAFFLEAWNGNGSYTVDRIGRGTLHIPALCLSIIGGIQPGPLGLYVHQAAIGGGGDDGLLQRFQLLVWPDASKTWENIDRIPNVKAQEQAYEIFPKLDTFAPFAPSSIDSFKTYTLRFTSEAQKLFDDWRTNLEQRLRNGDLGAALESHLAKYRSLMPSLALIFYLVETVGRGQMPLAVDAQAARQAMLWVGYLETHAKRLYASGEDPNMESARALLERIKKGDLSDGFSPRDVYHSKHWSKLSNSDQVENALKILEEFGWVRREIIKTPGRPSTKVIIHPQLRGEK